MTTNTLAPELARIYDRNALSQIAKHAARSEQVLLDIVQRREDVGSEEFKQAQHDWNIFYTLDRAIRDMLELAEREAD